MDGLLGVWAVFNLLGGLCGLALAVTPGAALPGLMMAAGGFSAALLFGGLSKLVADISRLRLAIEAVAAPARAAQQAEAAVRRHEEMEGGRRRETERAEASKRLQLELRARREEPRR